MHSGVFFAIQTHSAENWYKPVVGQRSVCSGDDVDLPTRICFVYYNRICNLEPSSKLPNKIAKLEKPEKCTLHGLEYKCYSREHK